MNAVWMKYYEAINFDVRAVLDFVLAKKTYEKFFILLENRLALWKSVLEREGFKKAKAIWMTPLIQRDDVLEALAKS
jgi:hypothetical protein